MFHVKHKVISQDNLHGKLKLGYLDRYIKGLMEVVTMENIEKRIKEMLQREAEENGCTLEEMAKILIEDWGIGGDRGYGIFVCDDTMIPHIERIDELDVYDGDLEAGEQAEKDGIKIIPLEENPKEYPYNCYRFIDTEENRKALERIKNIKH